MQFKINYLQKILSKNFIEKHLIYIKYINEFY